MHRNYGNTSLSMPIFTFGATTATAEYSTISESAIDIGNDHLMEKSWNATYLQSPNRHLLPREDYLPTSDLLVQADTISSLSSLMTRLGWNESKMRHYW